MGLREWLFGRAISTNEEERENIGPLAGVGVLGLDALASAAYGPEALLTVLLPLGSAGLAHVGPLTAVIVALLVLVALSYRQTIQAYPNGGGAYTVAKENLGKVASLLAAAALGLDYLLNVAVAISAGVGALVSAVPSLFPHTLFLCLGVLTLLTFLNLRGVRTTGLLFMLPTYLFVFSLVSVIALGVARTIASGGHPQAVVEPAATPAAAEAASTWLLLRAFANGCTAMTGVEAVSNGVPLFRAPSVDNARRTLTVIVSLLVALLVGLALVVHAFGITATEPGRAGYESVLSRVTAAIVGRGLAYHVVIASIVSVLALSANTSFADFPRVCRMLAADRFLPEPFMHRGPRLVFSHGVVVLAVLSAILLVVFEGITDALIPLFAVGALFAFTMSQTGMVGHWRKQRGRGSKRALLLNATGATATAGTLLVVLAAKLTEGAWVSIVLVAGMLVVFWKVRAHYDFIAKVTGSSAPLEFGPCRPPVAVVPLRRWDCVSLKAMRFAIDFTEEVFAVQVLTGDREVDDLSRRWDALAVEPLRRAGRSPPKLVVLPSEYRNLYQPLLDFVRELARNDPDRQIAVVVSELVEPRWYHRLLHNHTAAVLKRLLLVKGNPQIVIMTAPWYLGDWIPERRGLRSTDPSLGTRAWWRAWPLRERR